MRPQQQNRRMRGRNSGGNNNGNRKGPNPLTRNYESNGPDVKIRGSAQQIADKYAQLARDAQSAGDRVMAENYLQHAEHYNRIIAAAQAQMPIQNVQQQRDAADDDLDEERETFESSNVAEQDGSQRAAGQGADTGSNAAGSDNPQPQLTPQAEAGNGPQPEIEGMPAEVALNPEASGEGNTGSRQRATNGNGAEDAPRRTRRPRRERSRPETNAADEASEEGLAVTLSRGSASKEPKSSEDAALVQADS